MLPLLVAALLTQATTSAEAEALIPKLASAGNASLVALIDEGDPSLPNYFFDRSPAAPFDGGVLGDMVNLAGIGYPAIRMLCAHLQDSTPTGLELPSTPTTNGYRYCAWQRYDRRLSPNNAEQADIADERGETLLVLRSAQPLTVGDLCFWVLGQIVNRQFGPTFAPDARVWVALPSRDPSLATETRREWANVTEAQWRASLVEDALNPDLLGRDIGALHRLQIYFPKLFPRLAAERLRHQLSYSGETVEVFQSGHGLTLHHPGDFLPEELAAFCQAFSGAASPQIDAAFQQLLHKVKTDARTHPAHRINDQIVRHFCETWLSVPLCITAGLDEITKRQITELAKRAHMPLRWWRGRRYDPPIPCWFPITTPARNASTESMSLSFLEVDANCDGCGFYESDYRFLSLVRDSFIVAGEPERAQVAKLSPHAPAMWTEILRSPPWKESISGFGHPARTAVQLRWLPSGPALDVFADFPWRLSKAKVRRMQAIDGRVFDCGWIADWPRDFKNGFVRGDDGVSGTPPPGRGVDWDKPLPWDPPAKTAVLTSLRYFKKATDPLNASRPRTQPLSRTLNASDAQRKLRDSIRPSNSLLGPDPMLRVRGPGRLAAPFRRLTLRPDARNSRLLLPPVGVNPIGPHRLGPARPSAPKRADQLQSARPKDRLRDSPQ